MNQLASSARLRLENQVAVVTGGARGIGAGIVRRFVEEGARVVFSDLLNEKGKPLEEELGKNAAFYPADATSPDDTEALMNFAVERFGRLDCIVNNAGAGGEGGPIAETSAAFAKRWIHHQHCERSGFDRWLWSARLFRRKIRRCWVNEIGGVGTCRARD